MLDKKYTRYKIRGEELLAGLATLGLIGIVGCNYIKDSTRLEKEKQDWIDTYQLGKDAITNYYRRLK